MQGFDGDLFDRRMTSISIVTAEYEDEPSRRHGRRLNSAIAFLEAAGVCTGCPRDSKFSNQLTSGRRRPRNPRLLFDLRGFNKKPRMVDEPPYFESGDDTEFPDSDSEVPEGSETSTDEPTNENPEDGSTGDFLPTEEEILSAYSQFVQELGDEFVSDVLSLDEIELNFSRPAMSSKKSKKSGKSKGSVGDKKSKKSKRSKKEGSKRSKKTTVDDKEGGKGKEGKRRRI
jgi:hypothetical protein